MDCSFTGNSDAYGLGIRLGLYLQWVSTVIAGLLAPEELESFLDVNTSFTFAVLLVLVYLTATKGDTLQSDTLYAVEALILITLCTAGTFCGALAAPLPGKALSRGLAFRFLILGVGAVMLDIYGFWFHSVGMYHMARLSCDDKVFIFARANIFGGFRIFALVYHAMFFGLIPLFLFGILIVQYFVSLESESEPVEEPGDSRSGSQRAARRNLPKPEPRQGSTENSVRLVIFGVFVAPLIPVIEVTIKYNHIQGVQNVNNTGQLIPLLIGVVGFLQLLSKLDIVTALRRGMSRRFGRRKDPASASEERDQEANPGTRRAGKDNYKIQPNFEDALERRNTI